MTTGRINQVTILHPGQVADPEDQGHQAPRLDPPEGGTEVSCAPGWDGRRLRPSHRPTGDRTTPMKGGRHVIGHPIAPTEFPKAWSTAALKLARPPEGRLRGCCIYASRGGRRAAGHAWSESRRLPTGAYPQKSCKNLSQGPVIHRPHHDRVAKASRFSVAATPGKVTALGFPPDRNRQTTVRS